MISRFHKPLVADNTVLSMSRMPAPSTLLHYCTLRPAKPASETSLKLQQREPTLPLLLLLLLFMQYPPIPVHPEVHTHDGNHRLATADGTHHPPSTPCLSAEPHP